MKNNVGQLLAISSLIVGGTFVGMSPAEAIQLATGDFVTLDLRASINATTVGPTAALLNEVTFATTTGPITPATIFAPVGTAGVAEIGSSSFAALGGALPVATASVISFDLADAAEFMPTIPIDTTFPAENSFKNIGGGDLFSIDLGAGDGIAFSLDEFSTLQTLASPNVPNVITLTGTGTLRSFLPSPNSTPSRAAFTTTLNFLPDDPTDPTGPGTFVSAGDLTVTAIESVPESSTVSALIGLGLVSSAFALKRKNRLV